MINALNSYTKLPSLSAAQKYVLILCLYITAPLCASSEQKPLHEGVHKDVKIVEVSEWQTDTPLSFKLSDGTTCYIPANNKLVYDMMVKISKSGTSSDMNCVENPEKLKAIPGQ